LLKQSQRLLGPIKLQQGVGAAQEQDWILGMDAVGRLGIKPLGFGIAAKLGLGGRESGLVSYGRCFGKRRLGLPVFPVGIQGFPGGFPESSCGSATQQFRPYDRDQIDHAAQRLEHEDDPQPEGLLPGPDHMHAQAYGKDQRKAQQLQGHDLLVSLLGIRLLRRR